MKNEEEEFAEEMDYSEGFGGISEDVDLTQNIGCASNQRKKKVSPLDDKSTETHGEGEI